MNQLKLPSSLSAGQQLILARLAEAFWVRIFSDELLFCLAVFFRLIRWAQFDWLQNGLGAHHLEFCLLFACKLRASAQCGLCDKLQRVVCAQVAPLRSLAANERELE